MVDIHRFGNLVNAIEAPSLLMVAVSREVEHHEFRSVGLDTVERVGYALLLEREAAHAVVVDVVRHRLMAHERAADGSLAAVCAPVLPCAKVLDCVLSRARCFAVANGYKAPDCVHVDVFVAYRIVANLELRAG